jgi:hypothetical protein
MDKIWHSETYSWIHILVLKYAKIKQDQPLTTSKGDGLRFFPLCLNTQTLSPPMKLLIQVLYNASKMGLQDYIVVRLVTNVLLGSSHNVEF